MRMLPQWLLVMAICLTVGQGLAPAKSAKPPRVTALVGWAVAAKGSGSLGVVGGPVAGKGWLGGERAKGLMHKGDQVSIYELESGPVGTAWLTNEGTLASVGPHNGGVTEGLGYELKVQAAPGTEKASGQNRLIAVWHAAGSPEPRSVRAKVLDPKSRTYREEVAHWLRDRGVPKQAIDGVTLHQVVRADLNRDGRDEVLLSFYSADVYANLSAVPDAKPFSYLLIRYLPRGARTPRTVVVEDIPDTKREVFGLCDLDQDGWAEIVAEGAGLEWGDTQLYHWTGSGFQAVRGDFSWI